MLKSSCSQAQSLEHLLDLLRCPQSGDELTIQSGELVAERYNHNLTGPRTIAYLNHLDDYVILIKNRIFQFIPKIECFTALMARFDAFELSIPSLKSTCLQGVELARKPPSQ